MASSPKRRRLSQTAKSKYLNARQREDVYWAGALYGYLETKTQYYDKEALKWLNSTLLSLECFLSTVLDGIETKERRAIENMIEDLTPTIQVNRLNQTGKEFVTVDANTLYDFGEFALEFCKHCEGNYDTCKLRQLALKVGIPPYVDIGPCQYWREDEIE